MTTAVTHPLVLGVMLAVVASMLVVRMTVLLLLLLQLLLVPEVGVPIARVPEGEGEVPFAQR